VNGQTVNGGTSFSESTAEVLHLNVLGLVQVDAIKTVAFAKKDASGVTLDTKGPDGQATQFLNVIVLGKAIVVDVNAGPTKISIPGLATLWLNRVIKTSNSIEVRGVDLSVLKNNPLGVLLGTTVRLAVAHASVH
jgi:hypothetical protein